MIDLWLRDHGTIKGHILLIDLKGLAIGHVGRCSPMTIKHFLYYLQDGLPVRLKGMENEIYYLRVKSLILINNNNFLNKQLSNEPRYMQLLRKAGSFRLRFR